MQIAGKFFLWNDKKRQYRTAGYGNSSTKSHPRYDSLSRIRIANSQKYSAYNRTEHNDKHADKSATVEAVPKIIQQLEAQGYQFVTVPQLLNVFPYLQ